MMRFGSILLLLFAFPMPAAEMPQLVTEGSTVHLPAPHGKLTIAVIGDLHGRPSPELASALHAHHATQPFDAILILGDNFESGVESVDDPLWDEVIGDLSSLGVPLLPLLGNHDYGNPKQRFGRLRISGNPDPSAQTAYRRGGWNFPQRNYVISSPVADIVMIDSTPLALDLREPLLGSSTAEEVHAFVERHLERSSDGRWRIVAGHHNVAHSGTMRFRSRRTHQRMARLQATLDAGGADLYLSGHQHHAEIFRFPEASTTHLISGLAGPRPKRAWRLHPPQDGTLFVATVSRQASAFAVLEIDRDSILIRFTDDRGRFPDSVHALHKWHEDVAIGGN